VKVTIMDNVVRTGIALPPGLLEEFDAAIKGKGYRNRSEAVRDLIRDFLVGREWSGDPKEKGIASLTIVYDHHSGSFMKRMASIQHEHPKLIRSTLHTHLDEHNCLEVIVLDGRISEIKGFADSLLALKGVKHGKLVATAKKGK
jgi:CopG family nickel-responsive transcriptional regulator